MNDAGIQLIETMRVEPGPSIPLLPWHRRRLQASCQALGYVWPGEALFTDLGRLSAGLDAQQNHRVRLLVDVNGAYTLTANPLPPTPQPVQILLAHEALHGDAHWLLHKTTQRPWYASSQHWLAAHPNVFDILFCNEKDELCEGSRTNVYIKNEQGEWLTPALQSGLLPGVMRQHLLDRGLVREALLSRADLLSASALRISNALRGWLDAQLTRSGPHFTQ